MSDPITSAIEALEWAMTHGIRYSARTNTNGDYCDAVDRLTSALADLKAMQKVKVYLTAEELRDLRDADNGCAIINATEVFDDQVTDVPALLIPLGDMQP